MAFFDWDESYSVSVEDLDQQHQTIIELINELHETMETGSARNTVASAIDEFRTMEQVLDELSDYASYHFSTEEGLMVERGYPEYAPHKCAHIEFTREVEKLKRGLSEGEAVSPADIIAFLKEWWGQHILKVDKKYCPFLSGVDTTKADRAVD